MERPKTVIKIKPDLLKDLTRLLSIIPGAVRAGIWTDELSKSYALVANHLGYIIDHNGKEFIGTFYHLFKSDKSYSYILDRLLELKYITIADLPPVSKEEAKRRKEIYKNVKQHPKNTIWIEDKNKFAGLISELQTKDYFEIDRSLTWQEIKRIFDNSFGDTLGETSAKQKTASDTPSIPQWSKSSR
jgi:hypothetical protein